MMKQYLAFFTFLSLLSAVACSETPKPAVPVADPAPLVGNDQDEHGCKPSTGYQWSALRNECIRIFESGIGLAPKAPYLDKTTNAFIVFKSDDEDTKAEIFMPMGKQPLLLSKVADNGAGTWKADTFTLTQWKGMYTLTGAKGQILYEGAAVK